MQDMQHRRLFVHLYLVATAFLLQFLHKVFCRLRHLMAAFRLSSSSLACLFDRGWSDALLLYAKSPVSPEVCMYQCSFRTMPTIGDAGLVDGRLKQSLTASPKTVVCYVSGKWIRLWRVICGFRRAGNTAGPWPVEEWVMVNAVRFFPTQKGRGGHSVVYSKKSKRDESCHASVD
jgi:hypothetical protein